MFLSGEACVTSAKVGALLGIIWKSYNFFRCGWSSLISRDFFSCPSRRFCRCTFSAGDPRVHLTSSGARRDAAHHTQSADGSQGAHRRHGR